MLQTVNRRVKTSVNNGRIQLDGMEEVPKYCVLIATLIFHDFEHEMEI